MANADLLSYVGAVAGVIGAVTGIAGAVMGYASYRKTDEIKALELRLELMKTGVEVFQKADELGGLLSRAARSRDAVAAAKGEFKSGAHAKWKSQLEADHESLANITEAVDRLNVDYSKTPLKELERVIVEVHALRGIVIGVTEKYLAAIADDDRNREHLRQQSQAKQPGL